MNDCINLLTNRSKTSPNRSRLVLTGFMKDSDGRILLSPECVTAAEVNHCLDDLIGQLERIRPS